MSKTPLNTTGLSMALRMSSDPVMCHAYPLDAWVVGDEPVIVIDITGMGEYAKPK